MTKLHQLLAIEKTVKGQAHSDLTAVHRKMGKPELLEGLVKTYQPTAENGDQLPSESKKVQFTIEDSFDQLTEILSRLFDVVTTKEATNTLAKADVVIDGETLLENVPAGALLFLEKEADKLHTFIVGLPTLDPGFDWERDVATDLYASPPVKTNRTKKVYQNHTQFKGDEHHPPQILTYEADEVVGEWTTTRYSGALPASEKKALVDRVTKFREAVKMAREEANTEEVRDTNIGEKIFGYLFNQNGNR